MSGLPDGFTLLDALNSGGLLIPDPLAAWVRQALCSKGKRKGYVLASVPSNKPPEVIGVWRSIMSTLAPRRAGTWALLFASPKEREAFELCEEWLAKPGRYHLVNQTAQRPMEFNLYHWGR